MESTHSYPGSEELYPGKRKMIPILLGPALFVAAGIFLMNAEEGFAVAVGASAPVSRSKSLNECWPIFHP
ncbi:hypothetical protein DQX05_25420 [Paenibacillus thiaminolyticus]|uniref:Uncharacterized protein n=1 Tax=Paenibacillus thiaminolyticus TaxID=49283 RepID=A0A3A3GF50_PANTH|nr:hypothetical protein DQX05_25420 [Paenibacillus thiaminolyticus]